MADEKQDEEMVQTAVKLRKSWLTRIDKIAERMSTPSVDFTRTDAMRTALHEWIVKMEADGKKR